MRYNKVYVTHGDEGFLPYIKNLVKSVTEFSDIPIVAYLIDSNEIIEGTNVITEHVNLDNNHQKEYVKHEDGTYRIPNHSMHASEIFELYFQKPKIIKHALENYADEVVYLDGDSIATPYIDGLFEHSHKISKYPLSNISRYSVQMTTTVKDGVESVYGNPWASKYDITKCLEYEACKVLDIDITKRVYPTTRRLTYTQTGYIASHISHLWFYEEWIDTCYHPEFEKNQKKYMPFHEETIYNLIRWKHDFRDSLPYCYVEMTVLQNDLDNANISDMNEYQRKKLEDIFFNLEYDDKVSIYNRNPSYATPGRQKDICVLHGKTLETYDTIMEFLRLLSQPPPSPMSYHGLEAK